MTDRKRKCIVKGSFGGTQIGIPAVETICTIEPEECSECFNIPKGDFWINWAKKKVLCRPCMSAEIDNAKYNFRSIVAKHKRLNELKTFSVSIFICRCIDNLMSK